MVSDQQSLEGQGIVVITVQVTHAKQVWCVRTRSRIAAVRASVDRCRQGTGRVLPVCQVAVGSGVELSFFDYEQVRPAADVRNIAEALL